MGSNIMLALGALIMFGTFLGSSNKLMIGNNQIAAQNEYYIAGLALAQSIIDEAKTKAFDHTTDTVTARSTATLTAPASLGRDGGAESVPQPDTSTSAGFSSVAKFNDIDDYNNYRRLVNTSRAEGYSVGVLVRYASPNAPDSISGARTFCKRMEVRVTSPYFPKINSGGTLVSDTVKLYYAFTY